MPHSGSTCRSSTPVNQQSTKPKPNKLVSPPVAAHDAQPVPATFTPLPDDIYLPFIERPAEIAALISSPPDIKLFSLLAQTFSSNLPGQPSEPSFAIATFQTSPSDHHAILPSGHILS